MYMNSNPVFDDLAVIAIPKAKELLDNGASIDEVSEALGMHRIIVKSIRDHKIIIS